MYIKDENGNKIGEYLIAQVRAMTGTKNYKIIDKSQPVGLREVGEIQVTDKGIVRLRPENNNLIDYGYVDVGEVDANGNIFSTENGQTCKIGSCDANGKRSFRNLWLILHSEVEAEGQNGTLVGRCTESLRFRRKRENEVTLLARAAAALLLYKRRLTPEDEARHTASVPFGHIALPAAIIYLACFVLLNVLFNFHDVFPLLGHDYSYVVSMVLCYFLIIWIFKLIITDKQMRGVSFGTWLVLINRNTGIRGWNVFLIVMLVLALATSVVIQGIELFPLWIVLIIGVVLNWITYSEAPWNIFKPCDGFIILPRRQIQSTGLYNPWTGMTPDDLVEKQFDWMFTSIAKNKDIKADKKLTFSKNYIENKRKENPFGIDNTKAVTDIYKASKELIQKSPDQKGDWIIEQVLSKVLEIARIENLSRYDTVQLILSFCQPPNFQWIGDDLCAEINQGNTIKEYFRFPVETMYDKRGDCDCTAMMGFMLFKMAGVPTALLMMKGHVAIAIGNVPADEAGTNGIIDIRGKKYYYCETAGSNWKIGMLPDDEVQHLEICEAELKNDPDKIIVSEDF